MTQVAARRIPGSSPAAEALRRLPSTRNDLADELERGLGLACEGNPAAAGVLADAVDVVANFRHIVPQAGGFAVSLYVRGLLDNAYWAPESPSTPPSVAARIRAAEHLIEQAREDGIAALEAALSPDQ